MHSSGLSCKPACVFCTYMPHFCEWPLDTYACTRTAVLSVSSAKVQLCEKLLPGPGIWQPQAWTSILTFPLNKTPQWRAARGKYQHSCTSLWLTSCSFTTCVTNKWFKHFPVSMIHKSDLQAFRLRNVQYSNHPLNLLYKLCHPSNLPHFNAVSCIRLTLFLFLISVPLKHSVLWPCQMCPLYSARLWWSAINSYHKHLSINTHMPHFRAMVAYKAKHKTFQKLSETGATGLLVPQPCPNKVLE